MKVLKNNYIGVTPEKIEVNPFPKRLLCDGCGSELEYEKSDIEFGAYGCGSIKCPLCEYNNELWTKDECLSLTIDNVEFPTHFHHTSIEAGAVDISNEEIKKYIQKAINFSEIIKTNFLGLLRLAHCILLYEEWMAMNHMKLLYLKTIMQHLFHLKK